MFKVFELVNQFKCFYGPLTLQLTIYCMLACKKMGRTLKKIINIYPLSFDILLDGGFMLSFTSSNINVLHI